MSEPNREKFLAAKKSLRRVLRKVIAEMEQLRRDVESWNENRPDAEPIDVGGDIALAALARQILVLVETEQFIPDKLWQRFIEQAEANANA